MDVSLCMIVRNEGARLASCLDCIRPLVQEIIVVDTGSTDDTKAVAAASGALVYEFPWCDDFSAARNESIRHATKPWVFWLDADDKIDDLNRERLRRVFMGLDTNLVGYLMQCASVSPRGELQASHPHLRLFPNDARLRWERRVHEQIITSIQRHQGEVRPTDVVVHHHGYVGVHAIHQKAQRNLHLSELDCVDSPVDPYSQYCRGAALALLGRHAEALVAFNIAAGGALPDLSARKLYSEMARSYVREGSLVLAFDSLATGRSLFPDDAELLFTEAQLRAGTGDYATAETSLRLALETIVRAESDCTDATVVGPRARYMLALLCALQGKHADAEREARVSIAGDARYAPAWVVLADALASQGRGGDVADIVGVDEVPVAARLSLEMYLRATSGDFAGAARELEIAEGQGTDRLARSRDWLSEVSGGAVPRILEFLLKGGRPAPGSVVWA